MIVYKFSCPHCDQHYTCQDSHANTQITCARCKRQIVIPPVPPPNDLTIVKPPPGHTWDSSPPPMQPHPAYTSPTTFTPAKQAGGEAGRHPDPPRPA